MHYMRLWFCVALHFHLLVFHCDCFLAGCAALNEIRSLQQLTTVLITEHLNRQFELESPK